MNIFARLVVRHFLCMEMQRGSIAVMPVIWQGDLELWKRVRNKVEKVVAFFRTLREYTTT